MRPVRVSGNALRPKLTRVNLTIIPFHNARPMALSAGLLALGQRTVPAASRPRRPCRPRSQKWTHLQYRQYSAPVHLLVAHKQPDRCRGHHSCTSLDLLPFGKPFTLRVTSDSFCPRCSAWPARPCSHPKGLARSPSVEDYVTTIVS